MKLSRSVTHVHNIKHFYMYYLIFFLEFGFARGLVVYSGEIIPRASQRFRALVEKDEGATFDSVPVMASRVGGVGRIPKP